MADEKQTTTIRMFTKLSDLWMRNGEIFGIEKKWIRKWEELCMQNACESD